MNWRREPAGERYATGVRQRHDGRGTLFSELHRVKLPREYFLSDIDGMVVSEGKLYSEYVLHDNDVAFAALLDIKGTENAAELVPLRRKVMVSLCRAIAASQPLGPHCYEVIGVRCPLVMHEVSIATGQRTGRKWYLRQDNWREVWEACGIADTRRRLERWLAEKRTKRHLFNENSRRVV